MLKRALLSALFMTLVVVAPALAQKRCVKGIPCGNTCIAANKTCRVGTGTATRATAPVGAAAVVIPDGIQYVASSQGSTYYYVGCRGWRSLSPNNLRWFKDAESAKAARLRPSTQEGCSGPPAAVTPLATVTSSGTCTVAAVVDGDTLNCADGRKVRLLLVDAPEMNQGPFGALAKAKLEELAPVGTELRVEQDVEKRDRYGRELMHLYSAAGSVNEALLRAGVAVVSVYPPNVNYVERYRAVSDSAKAARLGLWATPAFECLPADHRAGRCR